MEKKNGWYWWVDHDQVLGWCYNYPEWIRFMKVIAPQEEIPIRLKCLRPTKEKLPDEVNKAGNEVKKTSAEENKAHVKLNKVTAEWRGLNTADKAEVDRAYAKLNKSFAEWRKASAEASRAYVKLNKVVKAHKKDLLAQFRREYPECAKYCDENRLIFPK